MKVKDIMVKSIVSVSSEDSLTVALNRMRQNKINQLPVINGGLYAGMITLKSIVTKNIDPSGAKCGNFLISTPSVKSNSDVDDAAKMMLNAGVRALPVIDDSVVGIISETDIIGTAEKISKDLLQLNIANIATDCDFVNKEESMSKVKKMMLYNNISRVPVVDAGNVVGVVGMLDMIKLLEGKKELPARGGRTQERGEKEKLSIENAPVTNFMHTPVIVGKNATLKEVISQLVKYEEAFILEGGVKIITPKDVLELIVRAPKKEIFVQIIGMKEEGPQVTARVDKSVDDFVQKMNKTIERIQYLFLHVERSHRGGKKHLYCIRARFGTPMGMFVARSEGWDPIAGVQGVLDSLEKEVDHKTGRTHEAHKKSRVLNKRK